MEDFEVTSRNLFLFFEFKKDDVDFKYVEMYVKAIVVKIEADRLFSKYQSELHKVLEE